MSVRACATKAAQIDTVLEQLRAHVTALKSRGTLVKNTTAYKKELLEENEKLKQQVETLKKRLIDAEVMNGRKQVSVPPDCKTSIKPPTSAPVPQAPKESPKAPTVTAAPPKENKKKAAKKEKTGQQQKQQKGAQANSAAPADVSRLNMRVGFIRTAKQHPDADGLYLEEIDCGEPEPRQVISGLVKHIPIEEMQQRPCVVLLNLKPAKMRGIMSHAMVMCASSPEKVEILAPPADSKPGDLVTVEGFSGTPDAQLNPKKKVFEAIQPDFLVSPEGHALYKGVPWKINGQVVTAQTMRGCGIK